MALATRLKCAFGSHTCHVIHVNEKHVDQLESEEPEGCWYRSCKVWIWVGPVSLQE
jgi:hypothetical protein